MLYTPEFYYTQRTGKSITTVPSGVLTDVAGNLCIKSLESTLRFHKFIGTAKHLALVELTNILNCIFVFLHTTGYS